MSPNREAMRSKISREPLRNEIRTILIHELVRGELEPDGRIVESQLAEELGISRTPLREALVLLEEEGLVESVPGKGFTISRLRREEASQLYELVGKCERIALTWSPALEAGEIETLADLNECRGVTSDPVALIELDRSWHEELTKRSRNEELLQIVRKLKLRLYRYEFAYIRRETDWLAGSMADHRAILDELRAGNLGTAAEILEQHWLRGQEAVDQWVM